MENPVSPTKHRFFFPGIPPMDWSAHKQFLTAFYNAFPDLRHNIEDILAEDDKVAFRLNVTGRHRGEFQGIPPTGKKVSFGATAIATFVDGKLAEDRVDTDVIGLMQQLGAVHTPTTTRQL